MNKLAIAIKKLNEGKEELEFCHLSPLERTALHSIRSFTKMSSADLATHLQYEDGPTDWLIIPFACPSSEAIL